MRKTSGSKWALVAGGAVLTSMLATTSLIPVAHAQGAAAGAGSGATEGATPAAQPDPKAKAAAKKAYNEGQKAYDKEQYAEAAESFKKADETLPSAFAKYWAAKSLDLSDPNDDQLEQKIQWYEAFVASEAEADAALADKLTEAKQRLEELKLKTVGVFVLSVTPAEATVTVDGEAQPPPEGGAPVELKLAPGAHKVVVQADGFVAQELDLNAEAGTRSEQAIALVAVPPPPPPPPVAQPEPVPPPPPPPPQKQSKVPAIVTLSIAGAGAAVGTVFGVLALQDKSDFDDHPTSEKADDVERNALIADMSFGVAITLGITGIVLLTSKDENEMARHEVLPKKARLQVAPYVGRHSGGAAARVTF